MSATFTLQSDTYTVYLSKPQWRGEDNKLNKNITIFDFWDNDFETVDIDISSQPLRLVGLERDEFSFCFPACFPFGHSSIETKFENIDEMMNNHEEVTISGLGDEYDGTYIIKDFRFETLDKGRGYFIWELVLEKA